MAGGDNQLRAPHRRLHGVSSAACVERAQSVRRRIPWELIILMAMRRVLDMWCS